jgi:hypothetical protein
MEIAIFDWKRRAHVCKVCTIKMFYLLKTVAKDINFC